MTGLANRLERMELKYVIDEETASRVARDLAPWCLPDQYSLSGTGGNGYMVQSLYLDTPSLAFHRAKERGDPERLKLRVRSYRATGTRVLELKRRSQDVIHKTRAAIEAGQLDDAAYGHAKLRHETPEARRFADRFARIALASGAEPTMLVRYRREAYFSRTGEYARATLDREIAFQRTSAWTLDGTPDRWCRLDEHLAPQAPHPLVVLELKCEKTVPPWVLDLVRSHHLQRRSFSKYSIGVHLTNWLGGSPAGGRALRGVLS